MSHIISSVYTDESDYTATFRFGAFVGFTNDQRRSCVNIMITEDLVYEKLERFSLRLADLGGSFFLPNNFVRDADTSEIIIQDNESKNSVYANTNVHTFHPPTLKHTHIHTHSHTHTHTHAHTPTHTHMQW